MKVLVLVAVLGVMGIETTSFAALLAAMGIAIGAAWAGLLSNFAAGIFLMVLRPFKVGDFITAGGVTGTVREIGMFVTAIDTPDNVRVHVGNNKLFSDSIQNFSTNAYRRVDLTAQLAHGVDPQDAMARLRARLVRIPNVLPEPAPSVEILTFTPLGPVLAVRPFCHNDAVLAGLLRDEPRDRRGGRRSRLPGAERPLHAQERRRRLIAPGGQVESLPMLPIRLLPLLKERPWGVRSLAPWLKDATGGALVGEAWFTANDTPIEDGPTLGSAIAADPVGLLGPDARDGLCPLLLKFLFTSDRLSVQVHPDDAYARKHHGSLGKTEAWHVLEARPGASLGLGFTRRIEQAEAVAAARSGAIEHLLDWRPTAAGDTWLVPAGTVHAIGAGVTVLEVQEHSDLTYRLYDYGRPRELHLERGFEVAELGPYTVANARVPLGPGRERLTACDYFTLEQVALDGTLRFEPGAPFYHLVVIGRGQGRFAGRATEAGHVWLVPAACDPFTIELEAGALLIAYTNASPTSSFRRG